jgi:hypothetical protein
MITKDRRTGVGFLLVLAGLLVQIATSFLWSPGAFIVAVAVGIPLVLAGTVVLASSVWRARRSGGDSGSEKA